MSHIFIAVFLFGENILTEDTMFVSFKKYLSQSEAKLVEGLINGEVDVQHKEMQGFILVFECKRSSILPSAQKQAKVCHWHCGMFA